MYLINQRQQIVKIINIKVFFFISGQPLFCDYDQSMVLVLWYLWSVYGTCSVVSMISLWYLFCGFYGQSMVLVLWYLWSVYGICSVVSMVSLWYLFCGIYDQSMVFVLWYLWSVACTKFFRCAWTSLPNMEKINKKYFVSDKKFKNDYFHRWKHFKF